MEAPYLVSRYDASTGEFIEPPKRRIGLLDRKLRIVNENAVDHEEWLKWALRAFQSCYGFEYQGDSLLIARINLIMTFYDCYVERWKKEPEAKELRQVANIIAWNLWQMDGFTGEENPEDKKTAPLCRIFDWRKDRSIAYITLKG